MPPLRDERGGIPIYEKEEGDMDEKPKPSKRGPDADASRASASPGPLVRTLVRLAVWRARPVM
ncbi:hypothetical protein AHiyo8_02240 [Arthrobacter sp. Hiyo8]|nr:hypothetical protein AHiyo8_02240 [Arthrobacter sp. Hiyo8]